MANGNTRPFPPQPPTQEQLEAFGKIARLLKGAQPEYVPVSKSLEAIGIRPKIMDIMIGDDPTECMVIPLAELIRKEWEHMSGTKERIDD
jgi:hypothetical protein